MIGVMQIRNQLDRIAVKYLTCDVPPALYRQKEYGR